MTWERWSPTHTTCSSSDPPTEITSLSAWGGGFHLLQQTSSTIQFFIPPPSSALGLWRPPKASHTHNNHQLHRYTTTSLSATLSRRIKHRLFSSPLFSSVKVGTLLFGSRKCLVPKQHCQSVSNISPSSCIITLSPSHPSFFSPLPPRSALLSYAAQICFPHSLLPLLLPSYRLPFNIYE